MTTMSKMKLSPAEQKLAEAFGMSAEEYEAHRTSEGAQRWSAEQRAAEQRGELKAAIHEALDEREGE
jgi:hypothetical protein